MSGTVDILEERICAAVDLIASLRLKVWSLESELAATHVKTASPDPAPPSPSSANPEVIEELERLRAERAVVRERIRGLLREIDRVSW